MNTSEGGLLVPHPRIMMQGGGVALSCALDGSLSAEALHGLFAGDTRVLSTYHFSVAGYPWLLLGRTIKSSSNSTWTYQNPLIRTPTGEIPEGALLFTVRRDLSTGILRDRLEIISFSTEPVFLRFTLQIGADFSDIFEVRDSTMWPRLNIRNSLNADGFTLAYQRDSFRRAVKVRFSPEENIPTLEGSLAVFDLRLTRGGIWNTQVDVVPVTGASSTRIPPELVKSNVTLSAAAILQLPFERAMSDLDDLTVEGHGGSSYLAAGVPWFFTLFGRDSLLAGTMSSLVGTARLNGALAALAPLQATSQDDWRDAEPGKLPHEIRVGELSAVDARSFFPYYGAHDAPALFCLGLWNAWRWSGDAQFLERYYPNACAALNWCETLGDRDADGLLEYGTRSEKGYFNQSWKDSGEAIVHRDGTLPKHPIATVELQGYFYAALLAMSELASIRGRVTEAERLKHRAAALRELVEERFWMPDEGFYAMGLDGEKRQIASVSSNPGHLLWCGLPSPERAHKIAARLVTEDLFSGWGLRTLSSRHVSYNPLAYQLGSVWPHDTLLAVAGLQRYGISGPAFRMMKGLLEAALKFEQQRLPELFCGVSRAEGLPVPYARANIPQAWAAAALPLAVQLLLGFLPDATRKRCFLNPQLPDWLPELRVENIVIGNSRLSVHLKRRGTETIIEHVECDGLEIKVGLPEVAPLWGSPV